MSRPLSWPWISVIVLCVLLLISLIVVVVLGATGTIFQKTVTVSTAKEYNESKDVVTNGEAVEYPKNSIERVVLQVPPYDPVTVSREEERTVSREKPVIDHILTTVPTETVRPKLTIQVPSTTNAPNVPPILPRKSSISKIMTFVDPVDPESGSTPDEVVVTRPVERQIQIEVVDDSVQLESTDDPTQVDAVDDCKYAEVEGVIVPTHQLAEAKQDDDDMPFQPKTPNTVYADPDGTYSVGSSHLSGLHRYIEFVVYINLDDDKAKRASVEREIDKLGLPDFVPRERLSAVKRSNSALGSFLSKIACLSKALSLKKNVLILDDDFQLLQTPAEIMESMRVVEERFGNRWDVIGFGQNVDEWQHVCSDKDVRLMRVLHSVSSSGFLVNKLYVPRLLAYRLQKLRSVLQQEKLQDSFHLDKIKTDLQRTDLWLTFQFPIGCKAGERWQYMDDLAHATNDMGVCQRIVLAPKLEQRRVAVCHMATGKYNQFVTAIQNDCYLKLLKLHQMEFFLFTDDPGSYSDRTEEGAKLHVLPIVNSKGYPQDNLYRFHHILSAQEDLEKFDFVFYMDVDYRLYQHPAESQLMVENGIVATAHVHNIVEKRDGSKRHIGSPETRPDSTACIKPTETMTTYFAGSFHGGATRPYLEMCRIIRDCVDTDDRNGITAKWLDESHLNRYLMDHPPAAILSQSYIFSEKCLDLECKDPVCVSLRESRIQPVMGTVV